MRGGWCHACCWPECCHFAACSSCESAANFARKGSKKQMAHFLAVIVEDFTGLLWCCLSAAHVLAERNPSLTTGCPQQFEAANTFLQPEKPRLWPSVAISRPKLSIAPSFAPLQQRDGGSETITRSTDQPLAQSPLIAALGAVAPLHTTQCLSACSVLHMAVYDLTVAL